MTKKNTRRGFTQSCFPKGFTLIELLVVVLIIGILAAVAVPQYQKAVVKARVAEYEVNLKALADAAQVYYLANGEYPTDLTKLDIEVPPCKNIAEMGSCQYQVGSGQVYVKPSRQFSSAAFVCSLDGSGINFSYPKNTLVCTYYFGDANCKKVGFTKKLDGNGPPAYIRP